MKEKQLFKFGEFRLCLEERALRRGDENIALTPKMYDLLLVLVKNHDRILEKEFLLNAVWPDSFVEEGNITFNIRQLRKALGDDAQSPTYIETIPRRGYRFVADVETIREDEALALPEHVLDQMPERSRSRRYLYLAAGGALILGVVVLGGWFLRQRAASAAPILSAPFSSEKLSTDGMVVHTALSADGKNLVYVQRVGAKQSLWVRQLDTRNSTQIIPPAEYVYGGLCLSRDGNFIYFARGSLREGKLSVYRMPFLGGPPQMLTDLTQGWISVSPDGQKVSYLRCPYGDEDYCSLYVADAADGGNEKLLVTRPRPIRIAANEFSPDGRMVAFAVGQSRTAANEFHLEEVDVESGRNHEITSEKFFNINYITWLPDESGVLLTALKIPDRHYRIWQVTRSTGDAERLTSDAATYSHINMDAKASALVLTTVEPDFHLNLYKLDQPDTEPAILANASTVAIAPSGKIIFSSVMSGNAEIWSIDQDGTNQRQLTNSEADEVIPVVSPDGTSIYYESNRSGEIQIWRMAPDGSNQRQLTTEEGGFPGAVSPDGAWVYYRSALRGTLRRASTDGGREEVVIGDRFRAISVSPDATQAAYFENQNGENVLTVKSLNGSSPNKTFKVPDAEHLDLDQLIWSPDGRSIAYVIAQIDTQKAHLWLQPVDGGQPRQVADLSGDEIAEIAAFALAPDTKTLAVVKGSWKHNAVLIKGLK